MFHLLGFHEVDFLIVISQAQQDKYHIGLTHEAAKAGVMIEWRPMVSRDGGAGARAQMSNRYQHAVRQEGNVPVGTVGWLWFITINYVFHQKSFKGPKTKK